MEENSLCEENNYDSIVSSKIKKFMLSVFRKHAYVAETVVHGIYTMAILQPVGGLEQNLFAILQPVGGLEQNLFAILQPVGGLEQNLFAILQPVGGLEQNLLPYYSQ